MKKPTMQKYFRIILLAFLAACVRQPAPSTEAPISTVAPPTSIPTEILIPVIVTPSPTPTEPTIPMITPDAIQVQRWKEYQTALAKSLFHDLPPEEVMCEWDILGQSDQEEYVWAICMSVAPFGTTSEGKGIFSSSSTPAVIYLGSDGVIQKVEIPGPGLSDYPRMFPANIQEKFEYYRFGRAEEMSDHLGQRREHPDEPPLIVLSVTPRP